VAKLAGLDGCQEEKKPQARVINAECNRATSSCKALAKALRSRPSDSAGTNAAQLICATMGSSPKIAQMDATKV
jgi:hypothetical protein